MDPGDRRPWRLATLVALLALALPPGLGAQEAPTPTRLLVRAVANDAKIIGSGVGGARITVRHALSGEILARGVQRGDTGDTGLIMREPRARGGTVYDTEDAAGYVATLMLERPTVVEVSAEGPLAFPGAMQEATRTLLMMPGEDVTGEGLVLTLHGFVVRIERPGDRRREPGATLPVRAEVTMMCGCPTEPGGLWNADRYRLVARIVRDGTVLDETDLSYAGRTSTYEGELTLPETEGTVLVEVLASDAERVNFGRSSKVLTVDR